MTVDISPTYSAALRCMKQGWSVIPLIGGVDAARGKTPPFAWSRYRHTRAAANNLHEWFDVQGYGAYGVVCGGVSELVVLDLDDESIAAAFVQQFPDLAATYTVRSGNRGTPHFYFRVDFPVKCQKVRGGDLKGDGGYVVGAGSVIAGRTWTVLHDVPVLTLGREQLKQVLAFLKPQQTVFDKQHPIKETAWVVTSVVSEYQQEVSRTGARNNTLFKLALKLRDQGMSQAWTQKTLAEVHARQGAIERSASERFERRLCEADKTIASAYSRPRRAEQYFAPKADTSDQIDNGIREALLKHPDGTAFLRVYEGLTQRGFTLGQTFTRLEALALLKGIVGDYSLRKALKLTINGERLFAQTHPPAPPTTANADPDRVSENKAKRCFVPRQKPTQSRYSHRPPLYYRMPSPDDMRRILGVSATVRDPIHESDLSSPKAYRAALEREFIKRRPGPYPQGWLAKRLGVSVRAIYSYHQSESIKATECYDAVSLTWDNLERAIPSSTLARRMGVDMRAWFMEDERGKRYPASVGLAYKLIGRGRRLTLKKRTFSTYRYVELAVESAVLTESAWWEPEQSAQKSDWYLPKADAPQQRELPAPMPKVSLPIKKRQPYYPTSLPDAADEQTALYVYQSLQTCAGSKTLSLSNARCLVELYGREVVLQTIRKVLAMHAKGKISNPTAFVITAARVSWRNQHGIDAFAPAPRMSGEQRVARGK